MAEKRQSFICVVSIIVCSFLFASCGVGSGVGSINNRPPSYDKNNAESIKSEISKVDESINETTSSLEMSKQEYAEKCARQTKVLGHFAKYSDGNVDYYTYLQQQKRKLKQFHRKKARLNRELYDAQNKKKDKKDKKC